MSHGGLTLRAGAAMSAITPRLGIQLAGDIGRHRPAEFVHDPLHARALVLESDDTRMCLLSLDLLSADRAWVERIQSEAASRLDLAPEAVLVHCTQIHSSPMLGHYMEPSAHVPVDVAWLRGGDDRYGEYAVERILDAVRLAGTRLEPVRASCASTIEGGWAFNRRFVMRDGRVRTHPPTADPHIRYAEGPVDPEVGIVCFTTDDGRMPALLLHYTCHPCHGYPHRYVSADWPGAWSDGMRGVVGHDCVPLIINGFCGNIHHANHLDPRQVDDYRAMGQALTEAAVAAMKRGLTPMAQTRLAWQAPHLQMPYRDIAREVAWAQRYLAQHPEPIWQDEQHIQCSWEWIRAVTLLVLDERRQRDGGLWDCVLQLFRIGDLALVGFPGEPFVEGQLRLKLESPTFPTYAAHNCMADAGYLPTRHAFDRGGYETEWGDLQPDALDVMVDAAGKALRGLFR